MFVVPWGDLTYIGTTDTDYDGPIDDPQCTPEDVRYLLDAMAFTGITEADVVGTWAGLRPLVKSATSGRTADLSRRHRVHRSPSGMVTITGGKLTTYREMSADTVDEVVAGLGDAVKKSARLSRTKKLRLRGAEGYEAARVVGRRAIGAPGRPVRRRGPQRARLHRHRPLARRAPRRRPALPEGGGGVRGPPRDGALGRRRAEPPHPRPHPRP